MLPDTHSPPLSQKADLIYHITSLYVGLSVAQEDQSSTVTWRFSQVRDLHSGEADL